MRYLLLAAVAALAIPATAQAATTKYLGTQGTITYSTATTPVGASGFGNFSRVTTQVTYDTVTDTYTVRDTGNPLTTSSFGPADISSSTTNFTNYSRTSGATTETFRLLNQSGANTLIVLNYVTYGQWRRSTATATGANVNDTYVIFGTKTPSANLPHSGSASYNTILDGTFVNKDGAYAVSGTGTFTANLGSGSISYSSTATGTPEAGGAGISFGTMTGSGSIAFNSASFKGNGSFNGNGYAMDLLGNFFGPNYEEIGGTFWLRSTKAVGGTGTGAIVGN
ncbi:MAG: hypothetical protein V4444_02185 [Pseudomonadota bacterium]